MVAEQADLNHVLLTHFHHQIDALDGFRTVTKQIAETKTLFDILLSYIVKDGFERLEIATSLAATPAQVPLTL